MTYFVIGTLHEISGY